MNDKEQNLVIIKKEKLIDKIINVFLYTILIFSLICIILNLIIIIKKKIYPDKVPDILGIKPFIVLSDSMNPLIKSGDLVFTKISPNYHYKENDIIAFRYSSSTDAVILHRIISTTENDQYITKGDSNNTNDDTLINNANIEGIYFYRIPKLGTIALFIRSKTGIICCLLIFATIFLIFQLYKFRKMTTYMKKRITEEEEYLRELREIKEG